MGNENSSITHLEDPRNYSSRKTVKYYHIVLIIIAITAVLLLVVFGYRAYEVNQIDPFEQPGSTLARDYFLDSVYSYFDFDPTKLPTTAGSCTTVPLKVIQEQNLISDIKYYTKCDQNMTLVKVCKLESGNYHFEVHMSCPNTDKVAYGEEQELTEENSILASPTAQVSFSYKAERLSSNNISYGQKQEMWKDEIPYENYKIVKETTYYRYRDKLWRYSGDVRYYYPQNKVIGSDVIEFYKESPSEIYPFKQVSQNYAYKWYIENDDGLRHYYPSGSTDGHKENTYYLTAPVKGAIRDEATKTYAAKYYRVEKTDASDYYPTAPSNNAVKLEDSLIWSDWSEYSLQVPKINPYGNGNREIETRVKVEVIPIEGDVSDLVWSSLTSDYVTEQELISQLRNLGYNVNTIDDVAALKDIKYDLKQTYRDEVKKG